MKRMTPEKLPPKSYWVVGEGTLYRSHNKPIFFWLLRCNRQDIIVVFPEHVVVSTCIQIKKSHGSVEMIVRPKTKV